MGQLRVLRPVYSVALLHAKQFAAHLACGHMQHQQFLHVVLHQQYTPEADRVGVNALRLTLGRCSM